MPPSGARLTWDEITAEEKAEERLARTTCSDFRVTWRNSGHWDIHTEEGRLTIRGDVGNFQVNDERPGLVVRFRKFETDREAMRAITDLLMGDPNTPAHPPR